MADDKSLDTEWTGHDLFDSNGEKIGTIEDVRYGEFTIGLKWLVVESGLFGWKKLFVPATDVQSVDDRLVVPYTKDQVKDAPGFKDNDTLTEPEEQDLCKYYGLDYVASQFEAEEGCVEPEGEDQST